MEFDILNELLTSTVQDLFTNSESAVYESKLKVKQLEGLIKKETVSRSQSVDSHNYSRISEDSTRKQASSVRPARTYKNADEWVKVQAPLRLSESIFRLQLTEDILKNRQELEKFIDIMSPQKLTNQKKKVKNELRDYDNDFFKSFNRQPNHNEKQPFRPLYVYYKKLKEFIEKKGGAQLSQEVIEANIRTIKAERRELRQKIEAFQRQFEATNNRKIRYQRDIAPIDPQYKKYKDLKAELIKFEEMMKEMNNK